MELCLLLLLLLLLLLRQRRGEVKRGAIFSFENGSWRCVSSSLTLTWPGLVDLVDFLLLESEFERADLLLV
jgi:hypothetical protein